MTHSIVQIDDGFCFYFNKSVNCGGYAIEPHHIFGGSNRKLSDEDGLVIYVCRACHDGLHGGPGYMDKVRKLRQLGQTKWEASYKGDGNPREEFMKRYGRNYL